MMNSAAPSGYSHARADTELPGAGANHWAIAEIRRGHEDKIVAPGLQGRIRSPTAAVPQGHFALVEALIIGRSSRRVTVFKEPLEPFAPGNGRITIENTFRFEVIVAVD